MECLQFGGIAVKWVRKRGFYFPTEENYETIELNFVSITLFLFVIIENMLVIWKI